MDNFIDRCMNGIKNEIEEKYLELESEYGDASESFKHVLALTAKVDVYEKHILHLLREVEYLSN